jgi:flagellar hook-associated protein 3 FlgL
MRVSSLMMTGNYLQQLNNAYAKEAKLMEQTDGSSLHRPSDNPVNYTKNLIYTTSLTENDQYQANVNTAVSWMKSTDSAMVNMTDAMTTIAEKTVAAANDKNATDPAAIGTEVTKLVQEVVSQGNSQIGGRYLFSGQMDSTEPFTLSTNKVDRGLAKTLDDTQSAFFSDTVNSSGVTTFQGAAKVGNLSQMLSMTGSDGNSYYLNTQNGYIYTSDFVNSGYKDAKNNSTHTGGKVIEGDQVAQLTTPAGTAVTVSTYFNSTDGTLTTAGKASLSAASGATGITFKFDTIQQQVVTYNGDNNRLSMVKQNGAINTSIDSVNVTGQDMFGSTDIFGGSAGTATLNDLLTVAAKMNANDSKWLSSDGITLSNNAHTSMVDSEASLAARTTVYNDASTTLDTQKTLITTDITNVSATDVSALAVKLMTAQTLYNMSLSVGSKILPKSLADYLS